MGRDVEEATDEAPWGLISIKAQLVDYEVSLPCSYPRVRECAIPVCVRACLSSSIWLDVDARGCFLNVACLPPFGWI